jgi:hypothetical protein
MALEPIEVYLQNLLQAANLDSLPAEAKEDYLDQLKVQVDRRVGIIIMRELDEAGREELTAMMEKGAQPGSPALQDFLTSRIENFEEKIKAGLNEFAEEFVAAAQKG